MTLQAFFQANPQAALAFSGGVDSAYLLWAGRHWGCDLTAYYVRTAFQPEFEYEDARRLAEEVGVPLRVVEADILSVPLAAANGPDRCYHCKRALFALLWEAARRDGHTLLLDGTNASDDAGDRPGMRALRELEVRSPLRECGLTKAEIRAQSKKAGLFTWNKPAYACLATRIPTGTAITAGDLERVEAAEGALFALGFTDFRVRLLSGAARIQLPADQWDRASEQREAIRKALSPRFDAVLLDLETR
ncbi:ATP-dependent sacrificial sulfur transferase LarE [Intestinimonas massiliensis]|uniref:ATP-dependent sacrificial sulfur transferase LarE n=1 Tax=Intestinimonas massiliensis (ex Afouda et al. 2020) TaxID=1673721 RepID=A0ABS9M7C2_9FIRM|nr:ATP-dependent sacrificial sulfur transferase LarE [Intestinimonas massiliensis (ex Afouda et al. 2020)]MCG4526688.1 ATP-dependent sacrificial sulfur transferase LarE [Intestinimonas massiliensis (ex Afouda et al. 2020)]MCQ4806425.1 ATP-dependent sacrificial sulfur transferase LarE [Intestinimonas massiliensis (ex Afouda et al. 2020)]